MFPYERIRVFHIVVFNDVLIEKNRIGADFIEDGNITGRKINGIAERKGFRRIFIPPWRFQINIRK